MKKQPNKNYVSDDVIMTPPEICKKIVRYFNPSGKLLEPAKGTGNFFKELKKFGDTDWCEISKNKDFMNYNKKVDWIITNPPWSKIRDFLNKSMECSDNVVFLFTINHLWTKARLRDIEKQNFGICEIIIFDTPKNFPQSGFQVGCVYLKRYYKGDIKFSKLC
jgi:hypothetical protein